jgi:hypothetical protein
MLSGNHTPSKYKEQHSTLFGVVINSDGKDLLSKTIIASDQSAVIVILYCSTF